MRATEVNPQDEGLASADRMRNSPLHSPRGPSLRLLLLLGLAGRLALGVGHAGVPQPPCVFYGQARDAYGTPYLSDAEVILRVEGRVCSRWPIVGTLSPGVNFKLPLELDEGTTTPYATYAAHPGQAVTLSVRAAGMERAIMETRALAVGQAGDWLGIYVTCGTDANHDGLPDEWQQMLVDCSDGALTSLAQVRPGDDFDGDGVSNLDEYRAGTYPFLSEDYLRIEELTQMPNGKLRLRFLTSRGLSYQLYATSQAGPAAAWHPVALALSEADGAVPYAAVVGDGNYVSVYVATTEPLQFYRLAAQ